MTTTYDALEEVVALLFERKTIDGEDVQGALGKERAPDVTVVLDTEPSQR